MKNKPKFRPPSRRPNLLPSRPNPSPSVTATAEVRRPHYPPNDFAGLVRADVWREDHPEDLDAADLTPAVY